MVPKWGNTTHLYYGEWFGPQSAKHLYTHGQKTCKAASYVLQGKGQGESTDIRFPWTGSTRDAARHGVAKCAVRGPADGIRCTWALAESTDLERGLARDDQKLGLLSNCSSPLGQSPASNSPGPFTGKL